MAITPDFCCGSECQIVVAGAVPSPNAQHWSLFQGTVTSQTAVARNGGRAYRWNPAVGSANEYAQKIVASHTTRWWRFYLRFGTLPSANCDLVRFVTASGTCSLRYRTATTDIIANVGGVTTGATAQVVTTGVWYEITMAADVSGATRTTKLTVNGVDKGTASSAVAATTCVQWRIGLTCSGEVVTGDVYFDDIITGTNNADYPVPAGGQIVGLVPSNDGTHSYNLAGDFIYNAAGGNVPLAATDTYTYINHALSDSLSTFLNAANPAAGEYLEWDFGDTGGVTSIAGVEVVSMHHAAGTSANLQTGRLVDGATVVDVFTDADFSQTTATYNSKQYAVAPSSSAAWTKAKVDALKFRWGSSWTTPDVSPAPYLDGVMLEVDYIPGITPTRFYFTASDDAKIFPAVDAAWERNIASGFVQKKASVSKTEHSLTSVSSLFGDVTTSQTCWGQWITPPLNADTTINTTVSVVMRCQENTLQENAHLAFSLRVIKPDLSVRGTLKLQHGTATEFPTSAATRMHNSLALSSVAALAGDRIVMEMGVHAVTPENLDFDTLEWGANADVADHTLGEGSVASLTPWFEIGQILAFDPEPANGTGAPAVSLGTAAAGAATLIFNASGSPTYSLSTSATGLGDEFFTASGAPSYSLSKTASGAATLIFNAAGAPAWSLSVTVVGIGTNLFPGLGVINPTAKGGRRPSVRFVDEAPEKRVKRPKLKPAPIIPEATALEPPSGWMESLFGPQLDTQMLHRLAGFRVQAPHFPEHTPEVIPSVGDRLMAHFHEQFGMPGQADTSNHEQFLENFLRDIGMGGL